MNDLNPSSSVLQQAYAHIQNEDLASARDLLDDYLITYPNDADAWWLYAHAADDPLEAQNALRTVLRLRPDYPGARDLLGESEQLLAFDPDFISDDVGRASEPPVIARAAVDEQAPVRIDPTIDSRSTAQRPVFLLAALIIAALLIGLAVILTSQTQQPDTSGTSTLAATNAQIAGMGTEAATPDDVAVDSTDVSGNVDVTAEIAVDPEVTANVDAVATDGAIISETQDGQYTALYGVLTGFNVVDGSASTEDLAIGQTTLVSICNDPTQGLQGTAINVLKAMAAGSAEFVDLGAEFIGARIVDCQRENLVLRTLAISTEAAVIYSAGELTDAQLLSQLIPVN